MILFFKRPGLQPGLGLTGVRIPCLQFRMEKFKRELKKFTKELRSVEWDWDKIFQLFRRLGVLMMVVGLYQERFWENPRFLAWVFRALDIAGSGDAVYHLGGDMLAHLNKGAVRFSAVYLEGQPAFLCPVPWEMLPPIESWDYTWPEGDGLTLFRGQTYACRLSPDGTQVPFLVHRDVYLLRYRCRYYGSLV